MNVCGPSLTSGPAAQQCRVMRLYLGNLKPRSRCPFLVKDVDTGITRMAFYLGSIHQARCWLANWNLVYLDCSAACLPLSRPSAQESTLSISSCSSRSDSLPQVTGSSQVASQQTRSWVGFADIWGVDQSPALTSLSIHETNVGSQ